MDKVEKKLTSPPTNKEPYPIEVHRGLREISYHTRRKGGYNQNKGDELISQVQRDGQQ